MKKEIKQLLVNTRSTLKLMWRIDRFNFVMYFVFSVIQVATSLLALYFASRVLGDLFTYLSHGNISSSRVFFDLILSVALGALEQVAWRCLSYFEARSSLIWNTRLAPEFNRKVASLDIERFENSEFNKLVNKVLQDYNWKPTNFAYYLLHFVHSFLRLIGSAVILIGFAPWMLPILILAVIPSFYVESKLANVKWSIWGYKGDVSRRYHRLAWMMQNKHDIMDMRIFGLVPYFTNLSRELLDEFNQTQQRTLGKFLAPAVLTRIGEGVLVGGLNLWLISGVLARRFSIQQYSFYSGAILQFNSSVGLLINTLGQLYEYSLFMTDYFKFMETPSLVPAPQNPQKVSSDQIPTIEFKNVSFRYPSSKRYVFKQLNLTFAAGEHVALVGENGVGKSTLIKLLLRYYDVTDGEILVNGVNIKELDLDSWYQQIGVLFQDFSRYPFSVGDNIWLGRVHQPKDQKRVEAAANLSGLGDMTKQYEKGYDTVLDNSFDDGVEPSGGQWQRVALGRAFYRHAPVLILDEPTAAIDAKAEYEIFNNIFHEHEDRTAIIVSHRFSTVRRADRIIVINNGKIIEQGTHTELMKNKQLYHELFSKQAEGYKD